MHDWTLVEAGIFHDFHLAWIVELRNALNEGLLPPGYYVPLEATYQAAFRGVPAVWKETLGGELPASP